MSFEEFKRDFRAWFYIGHQTRPVWDEDDHIWEILFVLWLEVESMMCYAPHRYLTFRKFALEDWRGRLHNTLPIVIRGLTLRKKSHLVRKMPTIQHLPKEMTHKFEHLLENIFKIHT